MRNGIAILLLGLFAIGCAGPAPRAAPSGRPGYMQMFEALQMTDREIVLFVSSFDEKKISIHPPAFEPMDRLL